MVPVLPAVWPQWNYNQPHISQEILHGVINPVNPTVAAIKPNGLLVLPHVHEFRVWMFGSISIPFIRDHVDRHLLSSLGPVYTIHTIVHVLPDDCFCAFVYAATAQFRGFSAYKPHLVLFCTAAPIKAPACFLTELAQCYSLTFHHVWSHFGGFGVVYTKHVLRSEHSTMVHMLGKGWHFTVLALFSTPAYAQALPAYSTFVGRFLPLGS